MTRKIIIPVLIGSVLLSACGQDDVKKQDISFEAEENKAVTTTEDVTTEQATTEAVTTEEMTEAEAAKDRKLTAIAENDYTERAMKKLSKADQQKVRDKFYERTKNRRLNAEQPNYRIIGISRAAKEGQDVLIKTHIKEPEAVVKDAPFRDALYENLSDASRDYVKVDLENPKIPQPGLMMKKYDAYKEKYFYRNNPNAFIENYMVLGQFGATLREDTFRIYDYEPDKKVYQWSVDWQDKKGRYAGTSVGYYTDIVGETRLIDTDLSADIEKQYDEWQKKFSYNQPLPEAGQ